VQALLRELLRRAPGNPKVDLITTDGFLLPSAELEKRGLMDRKGFPESYDRRALLQFVIDVKSGEPRVTAPVYSHIIYDIVPDERTVIERPDILIVEGLNVLQPARVDTNGRSGATVSDFFDFSVYVDADEADIKRWFLERFMVLRDTAFHDPRSFFKRFTQLSRAEALQFGSHIWNTINGPNLRENILAMVKHIIKDEMTQYANEKLYPEEWQLDALIEDAEKVYAPKGLLQKEKLEALARDPGGAAEGGESATLAGASSKTASATSSAMARPSASARSRRPSSSVTGPPADARPAERPAPAASFPSLCSVGVRVAAGGEAHAREPAAEGVGRAVGGVCCGCDARDGRSAVSSPPGRRPMSEEDVCSIVDTRAAIQSTLSTSRFRRAMTSR